MPASALPSAAGTELYSQVIRPSNGHNYAWDSSELRPGPLLDASEHQAATLVNEERDAAHALRRWHALMEIVHTEAGYVRDLRALVKVYLVLLPSLPLSAPAYQAVQELSQEASELLVLHERFLLALKKASSLATDGATPIGSIDEAVCKVAGLFIKEASTFDLYQRFCATQPDTFRLLRPVQARAEWAAFEQRCAGGGDEFADLNSSVQSNEVKNLDSNESANGGSGATPNSASAPATTTTIVPCRPPPRRTVPTRTLSLMPSAFKAYASSSPTPQTADLSSSTRRHSYDSLAAVFGPGSVKHRSGSITSSSESSSSTSSTCPSTPNSRLRFHDFLIKPVQRICKYPLMLEGLRSRTRGDMPDAAVASAVESMRGVATRVDEARRQKEAAARSRLIIDRIEPHAVVTTEFIRSLGECLLAGSLDVVHHHHILDPVTTPVRVRYLGAFLYLGGYLLLVKVDKGKIYRIKHWFSLTPFALVDISQDRALVPCSFRLSYMDHHFEIAAACQSEKDLWMRAINEARCTYPAWKCEPVSSLQIVQVDPSTPPVDGNVSDATEPPTVLAGLSSSSSIPDLSNPLAVLRLSNIRNRASPSNPTVRIFSLTDGSSILLRRSSDSNRIFVDRGLVDVLSELVSSLRKQALAREETLFPPPPHSSDTSQTIGIAAKNRLTRRGSMLVARPRALFLPGAVDSEDETTEQSSTIRHGNTYTSRSRLSLLPASSVLYTEPERWKNSSIGSSGSELQARQRTFFDKSHLPSGALSLPSSPTIPGIQQSSQLSGMADIPRNHRRARSLVGSVKDLMRRATAKRTYAQQASEAWQTLQTPNDASSDAGESTETASSTTRRRVSSAPTSPPLTPTCVLFSKSCSQSQPQPQHTIVDSPIPRADSPTTSGLKPLDKKPGSNPSNPDQTLNPRRRDRKSVV